MHSRSSQRAFSAAPLSTEFVESLEITREPRPLFARYFLAADRELAAHDIYLRRETFVELRRLHDLHQSTRNPMLAIFDSNFAPIPEDDAVCLIAYDHAHNPVATIATRIIDVGARSAKDAMEDLTFWFGDRAAEFRPRSQCHVGVPEAASISGRLLYAGGMWTHPDRRRSNLAIIITRLMRIYSHCLLDFDYEIAMAQAKFAREDVRGRYAFARCEHGFWWDTDGVRNIEGVLLWSPAAHFAALAEMSLRECETQTVPLVLDRRGEHAMPAVSRGNRQR